MTQGPAFRGRPLERAILHAGREYARQGRCRLRKNPTPTRATRDGQRVFAGKAMIDFTGVVIGSARALGVEAKSTQGASLPLADWPEHQQRQLDQLHADGGFALLVVAFEAHAETYALEWSPPLAAFLADPWRASLSLAMCQAWGKLVPDGGEGERIVWFFDGVVHVDRQQALLEVADDMRRAKAKPPREYVQPEQLSALVNGKRRSELTRDERNEHTMRCVVEGTKRAARSGDRPMRKGQR